MSLEEKENYGQKDQYSKENETRFENEDYDDAPVDTSVSNDEQQDNDRNFNQQGDYETKDDLSANNQEEDEDELDDDDDFILEEEDEDSELKSDNDYTKSDINQGL